MIDVAYSGDALFVDLPFVTSYVLLCFETGS